MTAHPIDTEALRKLADAATPGPWEAERIHHRPHSQPPHWCWEITQDGQALFDCIREDELDAAETAEFIAVARTAVPALLDALAAAEARATRAEAQAAIRGRAVVIYQARAREAEAERDWNIRSSRNAKRGRIQANARADQAEARIEAVRDVLDRSRDDIAMHTYPEQLNADIRRALDP